MYKLESITHSGTKGERGTPVTDEKYEYMVGSIVFLNPNTIRIGFSFEFYFRQHPYYRSWVVSRVKWYGYREDHKVLEVETMNSIYTFIDCGEFVLKKDSVDPGIVRMALA